MLTTTKIRKTTSITLAHHDMGGANSFKPIFNVTFPFFLITITTTLTLIGPLIVAETDDDSRETPPIASLEDNNGAAIAAVAAPPPPSDGSTRNSGHFTRRSEPFKPTTTLVVGVLTTMFSLTFLLLLYIKNCNGGNVHANGNNQEVLASSDARMNSGINRAIVELLPIFRFRSLSGRQEGLDCAVCLMRFEDPEVLRLLPKCKHAFHVECVDKWLRAHSTCPLCRYKVEPKDIATRQSEKETEEEEEEEEEPFDIESGTRRVPGRHSSVMGENDSVLLEIVMQDSNENKTTSTSRSKSLDGASRTSGGNFAFPRWDDKLLKQQNNNNNNDDANTVRISQHRLEHRIIIDCPSSSSSSYNGDGGSHQHLWGEAGPPSNLLHLTSEMITRNASISRRRHRHSVQAPPRQWSASGARRAVHSHAASDGNENIGSSGGGGVSLRSVSEITGLGRFLSGGGGRSRNGGREGQHGGREEQDRRQREGVATRWSAWISRSQKPRGDVR